MVKSKHLKLISIIFVLLSVSFCAIAQNVDKETESKIEESKKTNKLELHNKNRYNKIPDKIFDLINLQSLSFIGSECDISPCVNISKIPVKIKNLKNLKELNLIMNGLKSLPKELNTLKLESLDISNNFGIDISNLNIPSLKILNLNDCNLKVLPKGIWMMKDLTVLGIEGNNNLSDEQVESFRKEMPKCIIYWR